MKSCMWAVALSLGAVASGARGSEAEYQVVFEATWSAATHPADFPPNPHFSGLIGGTHNFLATFWAEGGPASPGMERMAEQGSKSPLDSEVNAAITAGSGFSLISGGGIGVSPGQVSATFQVRSTHPRVTLVSMIAPSPDWFVGVSGLPLFQNEAWVGEVVVSLDPYDAGTDSGVTFTSPNADTDPQDPIANLKNEFPFTGTPPLGTFTFRLLSVTEDPTVPAVTGWSLFAFAVALGAVGAVVLRRRIVHDRSCAP